MIARLDRREEYRGALSAHTSAGLERGLDYPTAAVLEGIAAALGVEIEALFARPEPGRRRRARFPKGRSAATCPYALEFQGIL